MSNYLSVHLLGSFRVDLNESTIRNFESDKVRALLAYLIVQADRAHSRESLAALLWPEHSNHAARNNLRQALFKLRQSLGDRDAEPPFLLATRNTIQFNYNNNYYLDTVEFDALISSCTAHIHRHLITCETCIAKLTQAIALYRGDFLKGLFIAGSVSFEEWALFKREEFHRLAIGVIRHLVEHHEQRGEYEQALKYARQGLELEPWQEEGHQQLMRIMALSGRRSDALAQYHTCRLILQEELGIEPTVETTALYEQIKAREVVPQKSQRNFPPQVTPFIDRASELRQLKNLLLNPAYRLITLVGAGGVGKTRLALCATERIANSFVNGACFVPLSDVNIQTTRTMSLAQLQNYLVAAIINALNFTCSSSGNPQIHLLNYLHNKEMLLLLDNFEHFARGGAHLISDIIHHTANVTVFITSRERLGLQMEYALRLEGLPVPTDPYDRAASNYSSVKLFAERADRAPEGFELNAKNLPDVVKLCQAVEGLPLAIELAAAWWGRLDCAAILNNIEQNWDFLNTAMPDVPPRHRSMRAVFENSWQLLSKEEQRILAQLSVFQTEFGQDAAHAAAAATAADLYSLGNKSLLHRTAAGDYEMHRLLRQFAAEKLVGGIAGQ